MWIQYQYLHYKVNQDTLKPKFRRGISQLGGSRKESLNVLINIYGFASAKINSLALVIHQSICPVIISGYVALGQLNPIHKKGS